MKGRNTIIGGVVAGLALVSSASAATLVDYKPLPVSPVTPEFIFGGVGAPSLQVGPGGVGNADGLLPIANQTPGGFDVETPYIIPGVPGSAINAGTTEFFDSTLVLTGLAASAPAVASGPILIQSLGAGTFSLFSTDPDGPGVLQPTLLLSGNIAASSFIVGTGNAAGEFNSQGVTYTGGVIYTAMLAAGGQAAGNSMSISMTDVSPSLSIDTDGYLADFTANATGLFSVVPEPTAFAGLALAGAVFGMRRRRNA